MDNKNYTPPEESFPTPPPPPSDPELKPPPGQE
jgi:hypothetical protein